MEPAVRRLSAPEIMAGGEVRHGGEQTLHLADLLRAEIRNGIEHGDRLESDTHHVQLLDVLDGELGDRDPPVRLGDQQALFLQHSNRLTQRCPTDSELRGEIDLRDLVSGGDLATQDRGTKPLVGKCSGLSVSRRSRFSHRASNRFARILGNEDAKWKMNARYVLRP
jgi:hypothetical protein